MNRDEIELLRGLPALDVDPASAERIRLAGRAELGRAARPEPLRRGLRRAYRHGELVLVGALAASYLLLAFRAALVPYL